jgi:hypothetical protein
MATKAERFRYDEERGKRHEAPRVAHAKRRDTPDKGARNLSRHAQRKAKVTTEESRTRPSRKSTRKSSNRGKPAAGPEYVTRQESFSPQTRHGRR